MVGKLFAPKDSAVFAPFALPRKVELADGITLWRADFREVLPHEVSEIAHVITDAPYEQISHDATGSIRRSDGTDAPAALPFAGVDDLRDDLLVRVHMLCRGWFLSFCTTEGVAIWRDAIEKHKLKYKTPMIWVKPDAMPKFNGQGPSHGHECIVSAWCGTGYAAWNGGGRRGVFTHNTNCAGRSGLHPTEKPVALMSELVSLFTQPGDLVCDPFMGSGTTGIACAKLGRRFLGIEIDHTYFDLACSRIGETLRQGDLFTETAKLKQDKLNFDRLPPIIEEG
jgi:site-specific DNA-methyltransferase (adenine-specific)